MVRVWSGGGLTLLDKCGGGVQRFINFMKIDLFMHCTIDEGFAFLN